MKEFQGSLEAHELKLLSRNSDRVIEEQSYFWKIFIFIFFFKVQGNISVFYDKSLNLLNNN